MTVVKLIFASFRGHLSFGWWVGDFAQKISKIRFEPLLVRIADARSPPGNHSCSDRRSILPRASLGRLADPFLVASTDFQAASEVLRCVMMNVIDGTENIASSDDELMKAVVNRRSEALECIYMKYESLLRAVIMRVIRDESEVDDILHDVLLQVWEQGDRYNPNEKGLRGLLVTLARRRALDRLRRRAAYRRATEGLKQDVDNPLISEITTTTSHLENSDLSRLLGGLIQLLPEAQREVIHLTFFRGLSQREIARQRRISLGTVKTRLHLAQCKLYKFLLPIQQKI